MNYANPLLLMARRFGRKLHVLRPLRTATSRLLSRNYEAAFAKALVEAVRTGDVVWDVGANVGFYTQQFAERVGTDGAVAAFEPAPAAAAKIRQACAQLGNVAVYELALSDFVGTANFLVEEETAVTNSLTTAAAGTDDRKSITVSVRTGDALLEQKAVAAPSVVKIDVEGYELEVLAGMKHSLRLSSLRALFVEVHFSILADRGKKDGPRQIVSILKDSGFHTTWIDASHIAAYRS